MEGVAAADRRGWLRATGLLIAALGIWVGNPGILIAAPFCLLVIFLPTGRIFAFVLAGAGAGLVAAGDPSTGFWYVERGWALLLGGCFLALSLRWPDGRFLPRGLGAVFGAFLGMGLLFWTQPGVWSMVDWLVTSRLEFTYGSVIELMRAGVGPEGVSEAVETQALRVLALQSLVFPALLGLASLSGLGLAWWLYLRVSRSPKEGIGSLREFRFNDQLVWILIFGVVALVASSGVLERIGVNALVFMGALYALRGTAVVLFLSGGVSFAGGLLFLVGFVLLPPFVIFLAMVIGLGDTWFDLRGRVASPRSEV